MKWFSGGASGAMVEEGADASGDGTMSRARRTALPLAVLATLAVALLSLVTIVLPGYERTTTSSHGSRFGYPAMLRRLGRPLPVATALAEERPVTRTLLAEGTLASDPVQVPMVPIGRVIGVYVQPGQRVRKGDLLAELDARKGRVMADTARLTFDIAKAQLKRVQVGSPIQLNREQEGKDAIDVSALHKEVDLLREEVAMKEKLYGQNLVSMDRYLEAKRTLEQAERSLDTANLNLNIASAGKTASEQMASDAMQQAALRWQEALQELDDFKIVAPADGIVDRVLVHEGEFNQMPGAPALVLAVGLWFEAYFDQTAAGSVTKGAPCEVHLAARPEEAVAGTVGNIDPIVSYTTGGPETGRPIRPIGTGGPEWPATFQVRVDLPASLASTLAPGFTGFVRLKAEHRAVVVPAGALLTVSGGDGMLSVVDGTGWHLRRARYGAVDEGWLEIVEGVAPGEKVIVDGHDVLQPGDRIREEPWKRAAGGS